MEECCPAIEAGHTINPLDFSRNQVLSRSVVFASFIPGIAMSMLSNVLDTVVT